jgi:undecaprenyl-diphosphatase
MDLYLQAVLLGILEGLTEFLPVSSTGHLILVANLIHFEGPASETFKIVIQLGAILAVCVVYWRRLSGAAFGFFSDAEDRAFVVNILIGFLPSMVVGALAYELIRQMLDSPIVVSIALIIGGIAIIVIERTNKTPRYDAVERFPALIALKIGLFQVVSMIPGVSRSGATIMGSLLVGVDRKAAAEYSFFLAIPTMLGAATYALYKNWNQLDFSNAGLIAIGFVTAFIVALIVVKAVMGFISRHGFVPFAWYRIALGSVMLVVLLIR